MLATPDFEGFSRSHAAGEAGIVRLTLVGDLLTPVAAFLKLRHGREGAAFLLESVEGGAVRGRFSMIGLDPDLVWRCCDGVAEIDRRALDRDRRLRARRACAPREPARPDRRERLPLEEDMPPMAAGLFGYLGYDMVRLMERLPGADPDALGVPDAILVRPTVMVVFDAVRDEISLITPVRPQPGVSAKAAYESGAGAHRSGRLRRSSAPSPSTPDATRAPCASSRRSRTRRRTISTPWSSGPRSTSAPATSFRSCCRSASRRPSRCPPSRSTGRCGASTRRRSSATSTSRTFQIVCSSPEILVRVRDGKVTIRPIAGTRPRGATPAEDVPRRQPARRPEGARRAPDAARSRAQRCRPGRRDGHRRR